jgi:hypothetical protein
MGPKRFLPQAFNQFSASGVYKMYSGLIPCILTNHGEDKPRLGAADGAVKADGRSCRPRNRSGRFGIVSGHRRCDTMRISIRDW